MFKKFGIVALGCALATTPLGTKQMIIDDFKNKLINSSWDPETLELGIRARFKCEYCGCNFFSSTNNYDSIQRDHLIPIMAGGTDTFNNLVLSCKTCNFIKRNWHPSSDLIRISNREELLSLAKEYVLKKRKVKETKMEKEKKLAILLLEAIENTQII